MDIEENDLKDVADIQDEKTDSTANLPEEVFLKEKRALENEFGRKRAKFKEIYLQKEEEYNKLLEETEQLRTEKNVCLKEVDDLQKDLDECKSLLTVAEYTKENEIEAERRKCKEEIASWQRIMDEALTEAKTSATPVQPENELINLKRFKNRLDGEKRDGIHSPFLEKEGVLSAVTKSLKRSVGGITANIESAIQSDDENLEESMNKAQKDAEMLRSLVVPLETEIQKLKEVIRANDEELQIYHKNQSSCDSCSKMIPLDRKPNKTFQNVDEKVNNLNHDLEAEKASRSDLEMYVEVLSAQKNVLQTENDKIQKDLVEICALLEKEKWQHDDLKQTWQRANDQFLESQRLQITEMRRMQSVLSEEQQRQIFVQKQEEENQNKKKEEELGRKNQVQELDKRLIRRVRSSRSFRKTRSSKKHENDQHLSVDDASLTHDKALSDSNLADRLSKPTTPTSCDNHKVPNTRDEDDAAGMRRAYSSSAVSLYKDNESSEFFCGDESRKHGNFVKCSDTQSLHEVDSRSLMKDSRWSPDHLPALTEAQRTALTGSTRESEARKVLLDSVRSSLTNTHDILSVPLAGKRLVSETEWRLLQEELKKATEKLGRPCDMCNNYETQLQRVQHEVKEIDQHSKTVQQMLERYKDDLKKEQTFRQDLENKLSSLAEQSQKEVNAVYLKLEESEKLFFELKTLYSNCYSEIKSQFENLVLEREKVEKELTRLQQENDSLIAKHSAQAQEMQNEVINLPNNLEDMQLLLLKYREEIIAAKVSKQHAEETLHSEIMFLRDRVKAEQTAKERMEDQLMQELDSLRENTGIAESIKSELEREKALRVEYEKSLKDCHVQIKQIQEKSRSTITSIQKLYEDTSSLKGKLESEVYQLRGKVSSLQTDLENNEAVQRDFVKLSQNLQVQLEKIRQSEKEVRWQHEDDVEECSNCKQNFSVTRRKHHCRHCGRIFCADCASKIVYGGPSKRQSKVCDVCHTLLVPNIAPYFSNEPPQTPD